MHLKTIQHKIIMGIKSIFAFRHHGAFPKTGMHIETERHDTVDKHENVADRGIDDVLVHDDDGGRVPRWQFPSKR